jgi:hypothetical protein
VVPSQTSVHDPTPLGTYKLAPQTKSRNLQRLTSAGSFMYDYVFTRDEQPKDKNSPRPSGGFLLKFDDPTEQEKKNNPVPFLVGQVDFATSQEFRRLITNADSVVAVHAIDPAILVRGIVTGILSLLADDLAGKVKRTGRDILKLLR